MQSHLPIWFKEFPEVVRQSDELCSTFMEKINVANAQNIERDVVTQMEDKEKRKQ